jgi:hypothetical protein
MSTIVEQLNGFWLYLYFFFVIAAFVGAWLFPILYVIFAPWRTTEVGRHLFWFSFVVAYAISTYLPRFIWAEYPGRALVSYSSIIALVIVVWWRVSLFVRTQVRAKKTGRSGYVI